MKAHLTHPIFTIVSQVAEECNQEVYTVGGYVRDLLLNRPSKDIDIVVVGSGIEFAKKVAKKIDPKLHVSYFKNFGTAMLKYEDFEIEFVGARKESYHEDSRKPLCEDGTLQEDQERRDFTINALAICLNKERFGELVDPFNGQQDLKDKILKTPLAPDQTYSDDPLRMMRAIRFSTQLDFTIEQNSLEAISRNKERIKIVSQERISTELNKIILATTPSKGFKLLFNTGLLAIIFPEMVALHGVEKRNGMGHKDNFYHTLKVLDNLSENSNDLWLRWAAILHDIAKPATKRFFPEQGWTFHGHEERGARMVPTIFRRLKLPLDHKMKYVSKLVRLHLRPIALVKEEVSDSAIRRLLFEAGEDLEDLMLLCRADITSKNEEKINRYIQNFNLVEEKLQEVEQKDQLRNWQPPISGEEVMEAFNLKPCKEVGMLKNAIREAILEGEIENNKEEALNFMHQKAKELGIA